MTDGYIHMYIYTPIGFGTLVCPILLLGGFAVVQNFIQEVFIKLQQKINPRLIQGYEYTGYNFKICHD
jgi:hypothetical protein